MKPRVTFALIVAMATIVLVSPISADATLEKAGGISYRVTKNTAALPSGPGGASCPAGTYVLGGGISSKEPFGMTFVADSLPGGGRHGWNYESRRVEAGPFTYFASAICDEKRPSYVDESFEVAPDTYGSDFALCPTGQHVYSGGAKAKVEGGFGAALTTSHPVDGTDPDTIPDDGWGVSAQNFDFEDDLKEKIIAVCGKQMPTYVAVPGFVSSGTQGGQTVTCDQPHRFLYGGGQAYSGTDQTFVSTSGVALAGGGQANPRQWSARVDNYEDPGVTMVASGVCGPPLE